MDKPPNKHHFSDYFYNGLSYFGVILAFLVFFIELLLFGIDFFSDHHSVYLGIITYTVLPPFLILGLLLIPIGALRRRGHIRKGLKSPRRMPIYVNFHNPKHRNAFLVFIIGTTIFIIMSVVGSYQAYHYTESVHFCGTACHDVMEPQFTRYLQSPHARVKCVECHVGGGVDSYMSSKLEGVHQIVSLVTKTYPRPITGPLANLRPAEEICERCHWPGKTFGTIERNHQYFVTDEEGPKTWFLRMIMNVGTKDRNSFGIHTHMYLDHDIYYVAEDEQRQEISWVKSVDKQGKATVFTPEDSPYANQDPPPDRIKKMDCIDCHNRPTHHFMSPVELADQAIAAGTVDASLPSIKTKMTEVLSQDYAGSREAQDKIHESFTAFYRAMFKDNYARYKNSVENTASQIQSLYKTNFFPHMKARWDKYPDNIGHLISPGCFRCHGGEHTSKAGRIIPRDCTTCHSIIEQGPAGNLERGEDGLLFRHPVDIGEAWQDLNCFECHTGQ